MAHRRASDAAGSGRGADAQTAVPDAGAITRRQRDEFAELARPHMGAMLRTAAALDATLPVDDSLGGVTHAARLDLRAAINGLEHALRLAVVLRYYAGLDATEIGAIMALPPPTVRSHLRRARLLLRRALDPPGDDSAPARERGGPRC